MAVVNQVINISTQESSIRDYITLMKPRVMSLVVFSGLAGLLVAPGHIHPFIGFIAILCIAMASGASGAINMWYDADIDAVMDRTKKRPTVTGIISPQQARDFGIVLGFLSVVIMAVCVNIISSLLLLLAILFYVFVYTIWLKRNSVQNVVIGGASGAFPPMIGWAAVTGNIAIESIILFMIIFTWTPPHTWALALYKIGDYKNGNIPMLPVVKGDEHTKHQIILYTALMIVMSLAPYYFDMSGSFYMFSAVVLGGVFLYYTILLLRDKKNTIAPKVFGFSIIYLFLIFVTLVIDNYIR
ncbi:MAG: protoheme farnesyltransferase [Rickettsiaceae bacterium]|jgi:protoheme IX farnesyltransferase|nr:protoheme farnesyltransferase [Rickettsiaceae bacterium]